MLLRLMVFRLLPVLLLKFYKEKNKIRLAGAVLLGWYVVLFVVAVSQMCEQTGWKTLLYLPISMVPHYLCYGFAVWLLIRCMWSTWSVRVWKRIYRISIVCILMGILMENYWNPRILEILLNFSK